MVILVLYCCTANHSKCIEQQFIYWLGFAKWLFSTWCGHGLLKQYSAENLAEAENTQNSPSSSKVSIHGLLSIQQSGADFFTVWWLASKSATYSQKWLRVIFDAFSWSKQLQGQPQSKGKGNSQHFLTGWMAKNLWPSLIYHMIA